MDETTRDRLNRMFQARNDAKAAKDAEADREKAHHEAAVKRFTEVRDTIIQPAMQTIAAYLKEQGYSASIGLQEDRWHASDRREIPASVTLLFSMGRTVPLFAPHARYQAGPFFEATFDKRTNEVRFSQCLHKTEIRHSRPQPAGAMPLAELTRENMEAKIAETVQAIFRITDDNE